MSLRPEGELPQAGQRSSYPAGRRTVALAAVAVLLAAADTYVVVLALPDMMVGVGLSLDELHRASVIISAFLLGYVTALPLVGRLADVRGRVPVLVGCLLIFAFGSLLTAAADTLALAVVGRALQGVGGGGLVPATLALVADVWPAERRGLPLGMVGAVQEVGSVVGPLYGAALIAVSGWRAIFWVNLAAGAAVAVAIVATAGRRAPPTRGRAAARLRDWLRHWVLPSLALTGVSLAAIRPDPLVASVTAGTAFVPLVESSGWTSPIALVAAMLALSALVAAVRRSGRPAPWQEVDLLGAGLLAVALGGVVLAFAGADPSRQAVADSGWQLLGGSAVAAALFVLRQRAAAHPLVPAHSFARRAAWGAVLVNLFVGAALVVALVDVPVFARATRFPDSQLGAALVLVQLLAAIPVGAVVGGWALSRVAERWLAAVGLALCGLGLLAMAGWSEHALSGPAASVALIGTGLGFGVAIAPVNAALLAATDRAVHGIASALAVVARMVGMLTGLSVLTAFGLRVFYRDQAAIGTPLELCPATPDDCPAYEVATRSAIIHELSVMFMGAAVCAGVAAVLALLLLGSSASQRRAASGEQR